MKKPPVCPPRGAVIRPLAVAPCTTDVHTVWGGGSQRVMLGHESTGEILEVGPMVRDFRPGDAVIVPSMTPDWSDIYSQEGTSSHTTRCRGSCACSPFHYSAVRNWCDCTIENSRSLLNCTGITG